MKLCIDCVNYVSEPENCRADGNLGKSPVDGKVHPRFPLLYIRAQDQLCGLSARWFEPRVKQPLEAASGACEVVS